MLVWLPRSNFIRSPWKNGLGFTDQIAIDPPTAELRSENYLWRISTAPVLEASVFSAFPAYERILVVLAGRGLKLLQREDLMGEAIDLPPLIPYRFSGDQPPRCELINGPVQDLSVFLRRGRVTASVEIVNLLADSVWMWSPGAGANFLIGVQGAFAIEGRHESLVAGDALRVDRLPGDAKVFFALTSRVALSIAVFIRILEFGADSSIVNSK